MTHHEKLADRPGLTHFRTDMSQSRTNQHKAFQTPGLIWCISHLGTHTSLLSTSTISIRINMSFHLDIQVKINILLREFAQGLLRHVDWLISSQERIITVRTQTPGLIHLRPEKNHCGAFSDTWRASSPAVAGHESMQGVLNTWHGFLRHLDWFIYDLDINTSINTTITINIRMHITYRTYANIRVKENIHVHEIAQSLLRHLD